MEIHYVCPGSCGGKVSEEDYEQGKKTCQVKDCPCHGDQLHKMMYCPNCDEHFDPGTEHHCQ